MIIKCDIYILHGIFVSVLSALFLFAFILMNKALPEKTIRFFCIALTCALILTISESIDYYLCFYHKYPGLRVILGSLNFIMRINTMGFTVRISQRTKPKISRTLYIGMILNAVFCILNIPFKCIFNILPDHNWIQGPLFYAPYIFVGFVIFLLITSAISQIKQNPGEAIIIFGICVVCITGNMLELFPKPQLKLMLSSCFIISIVFYFLSLNVQLYRRDSMTNLLNRRSLFLHYNKNVNKKRIILSMDLNNLKKINDYFGHAQGDNAICTVSMIMQEVFHMNAIIYRTGGDEFIGIFTNTNLAQVEKKVEEFKERLKSTKFSVACGISEYKPGDNFDNAIKIADMQMYIDKHLMKGGNVR